MRKGEIRSYQPYWLTLWDIEDDSKGWQAKDISNMVQSLKNVDGDNFSNGRYDNSGKIVMPIGGLGEATPVMKSQITINSRQ